MPAPVVPPVSVDHLTEVLDGLPPRLRTGAYARVLLILARPLMDLEIAIDDASRAFSLLTSKTPLFLLRDIAGLVGLTIPPGFTNEDYRVFIRAQAAAVLSSGTWPQMQAIADLLRPDGVVARAKVHRLPPNSLQIEIPGLPSKYHAIAREILEAGKRAQDRIDIVPTSDDPSIYWTLDIGPGPDQGLLAPLI